MVIRSQSAVATLPEPLDQAADRSLGEPKFPGDLGDVLAVSPPPQNCVPDRDGGWSRHGILQWAISSFSHEHLHNFNSSTDKPDVAITRPNFLSRDTALDPPHEFAKPSCTANGVWRPAPNRRLSTGLVKSITPFNSYGRKLMIPVFAALYPAAAVSFSQEAHHGWPSRAGRFYRLNRKRARPHPPRPLRLSPS